MIIIQGAYTIMAANIATGETVQHDMILPLDVTTIQLKRFCRQKFTRFIEITDFEPIQMELSGDR
jgi:hypothetical protein